MKRREFLKSSVVAGTAGVVFDACTPTGSEQVIPLLIPEERFIPGVEEFVAATCFECPAGCGLLARKIDARLVKVEGNPAHPISQGGSCARGQALPQAMYHPDRLQQPLARDGARGAGQWQPISWDDAVARVVSELTALQQEAAHDALAFLTGGVRAHRREMVTRFLRAFGASRHWTHEPFGDGAARRAHDLTTGTSAPFAYDLERASYVVAFGAGLVEGLGSPVRFGRGLGHLRRGRAGRRGKLVSVEPRLSLTAANADEWLPARPGTEALVALGLAHVLIRDERYDADYVRETDGFEAFRDRALADFGPEQVAALTGVEAERLERIAHEMADAGPTVAILGEVASQGSGGLSAALAVAHLNAVLGAFGRAGGVFFDPPPPFAPWPELATAGEEAAAPPVGSEVASTPLARALAEGAVGADTRVLFVAGTNPIYSMPPALGAAAALAEIPFIVSFASFVDETTAMADLVLPEPTPFERFDDDVPAPGIGVPIASLSGPVFSRPLYDTVSMPDVLLRVAEGLGAGMAEAFPWSSYEAALRQAWGGLQAAGRGSLVEAREARFWTLALEAGGWWDTEAAPQAVLATRSGRYRFELGPLEGAAQEVPVGGPDFPLTLEIYSSVALGDGRSAHLPFLQELADPMTGVRWGTVVELNPATAAGLGVAQGSLVAVVSAGGRLEAPAFLNPGLHPDAVAIAAGQGHEGYGRFANGRGVNPFVLASADIDPDAGEAARAVPVRVERI